MECNCKAAGDQSPMAVTSNIHRCVWVPGAVVVGAGPSGLAVAACMKEKGVPCLVLERANCIASLWQKKTYDRLRLHLPKNYCDLPLLPFPSHFPTYPSKRQFVSYLEDYARRFHIHPVFNSTVESAEYDSDLGLWKVRATNREEGAVEYSCRWMVVASGENADAHVPEIDGVDDFKGAVIHTSMYSCGEVYMGKRVLVVGCGNSGMEVCLDLCNHEAFPSLVVRDAVHILPREMFGRSTFELSMKLLKWLPIKAVDRLLIVLSNMFLGDTAKLGLRRPKLGPLEHKAVTGTTPVLDVGALGKISAGVIKVYPALKRVTEHGAEFMDGRRAEFSAIIMATGYRSNVLSWLKGSKFFATKNGMPSKSFLNSWKGDDGLYAVGFSRRGLLGASMDAKMIADDISQSWRLASRRE